MCQQLLFKFFESYCEMYKKFEELLKTNGCTAYKVSKATGIPGSTFTAWKKGKYQPKSDKLQKIADYFNVPLGYFYGEEEKNKNYQHQASFGYGSIGVGCFDRRSG